MSPFDPTRRAQVAGKLAKRREAERRRRRKPARGPRWLDCRWLAEIPREVSRG